MPSQAKILDMIGETLIAPGAYSTGIIDVESPLVFPLLEAFPGTHLQLYYHKKSRHHRYLLKENPERISLVSATDDNFPKYLTRLSKLQTFYDYGIIGLPDQPLAPILNNVWPRINVKGLAIFYGSNVKRNTVDVEVRYKKKWVVVIGCCRGATEYIYAVIQKAKNLNIYHQQYGFDGIVGGDATGTITPQGSIIIHQVRSPLGVIASSSMRAKVLDYYCAPLMGYVYDGDPILWGMHYWYRWNRMADRKAQFTYRVEDLANSWTSLCHYLGISGFIPRDINTDKNSDKSKPSYPHITWETLEDIDQVLADKIKTLAIEYGYEIEQDDSSLNTKGGRNLRRTLMQFKYDTYYLENLLEMYAGSFEKINLIRWGFIAQLEAKIVLDYGSGNGNFNLFRPDDVIVDSYDIGRIGNAPYPQTGIRHEEYNLVCFWDVLEHVDWKNRPDSDIIEILKRTQHVAATIPILPEGAVLEGWKHYKPGEHLTYFTKDTFTAFMDKHKFQLMKYGTPECPPRQDIHSFIFSRAV